jgi:hypothetical protein
MIKIHQEKLRRFESTELVKAYLVKNFNLKSAPSAQKVEQVCANFTQGRTFFESALIADIAVKPLLMYYGVLAYSKGLILLSDGRIKEETLKQSHGLSLSNWNEVSATMDLENLKVKVLDGTFLQLLNYTDYQSNICQGTSYPVWSHVADHASEFGSIKFSELCHYFPNLKEWFDQWANSPMNIAEIDNIDDSQKGYITVRVRNNQIRGDIEKIFPPEYFKDVKFDENSATFGVTSRELNMTQRWNEHFKTGNAVIFAPLENGSGINVISAFYAISYVLGMMARYYPASWMGIHYGGKGNRLMPFVIKLMNYIEEYYLKTLLDHLRIDRTEK